MKFILYKPIFILILITITNIFAFAQTERDKGIELYRQGKDLEAIRVLQKVTKQKATKTDAEVWNYLGLAYINQERTKDGRKALEKAVKYAPQNSVYHSNLAYAYLMTGKTNTAQSEVQKAIQLDPNNANAFYVSGIANLWEKKFDRAIIDADRAITISPQFSAAYVLKSSVLLSNFGRMWAEEKSPRENLHLLEQAVDSLEKCLSGCPKDGSFAIVEERMEAVKAFLDYFNRIKEPSANLAVSATDNKTPLNILFKPKPIYTDAARQANEEGEIDMAVLFGSDGKVKYTLVLKGLGYGLNEQAVRAARSMTFEPVTENGKLISVVKRVIYKFDIY